MAAPSSFSYDLAELVGILLGDGSINIYPSEKYSTYYCVKVSFNSQERQYINHVSHLMKRVLGVVPKKLFRANENTAELLIYRKAVVEKLLVLGLRSSPKWERAVIPARFLRSPLDLCVLRGYFDTDGSVVIANNNGISYARLEMKISPSPMQQQLLKILKKNCFAYHAYAIGKGKVRVQMNGREELRKWMQLVGFHNEKHARRARSLCSHTRRFFKTVTKSCWI